MKHKVGDKVRIRKDLISGTCFHDYSVTRDMCEMGGKEAVIKMVRNRSYLLSINGIGWRWTDEMLEDVEKEVEDFVKIKWQDGTIPEVGRNGVQIAEALEVVLQQLKGYQEKFTCKENAISITKIEEAIMWQEKRTNDRNKRGVEGKHII